MRQRASGRHRHHRWRCVPRTLFRQCIQETLLHPPSHPVHLVTFQWQSFQKHQSLITITLDSFPFCLNSSKLSDFDPLNPVRNSGNFLISFLILAGMKYNYASPACSSPSTTWERENNEPKSMPDPEIRRCRTPKSAPNSRPQSSTRSTSRQRRSLSQHPNRKNIFCKKALNILLHSPQCLKTIAKSLTSISNTFNWKIQIENPKLVFKIRNNATIFGFFKTLWETQFSWREKDSIFFQPQIWAWSMFTRLPKTREWPLPPTQRGPRGFPMDFSAIQATIPCIRPRVSPFNRGGKSSQKCTSVMRDNKNGGGAGKMARYKTSGLQRKILLFPKNMTKI